MPIHDWTRVTAGTFHDFHTVWMGQLRTTLNKGVLPKGYYALAEQIAGQIGPDVLTLQDAGASTAEDDAPGEAGSGGVALAEAPPRVSVTDVATEALLQAARRRQLVIRHVTGDRIVAIVEIVSPGNKERQSMLDSFVDKAVAALDAGYQLLILDLFPPSRFDPGGIHGAVWSRMSERDYLPPDDKPLTLAAYTSGEIPAAYVEPIAVGMELPEMQCFSTPITT